MIITILVTCPICKQISVKEIDTDVFEVPQSVIDSGKDVIVCKECDEDDIAF